MNWLIDNIVMSTRVVESDDVRVEVQEKCSPSYHSVWMAHWGGTTCKSPKQGDNQSSVSYKSSRDNLAPACCFVSGQEIGSASSKLMGEVQEETKDKMINFMSDNLKMCTQNPEGGRFSGLHIPLSKLSQTREASLALENGESYSQHEGNLMSHVSSLPGLDLSLGKTVNVSAPNKLESKLRQSCLLPDYITANPDKQVTSNRLNNLLVAPKAFFDENFVSSLKIVSNEYRSSFPMWGPFSQQNKIDQPSTTVLVHGTKMNSAATLCDLSTVKSQQGDNGGRRFKIIDNPSNTQLFPSQIGSSQAGELQKLYHETCSLPNISPVHGVETMKIYTTIDTAKDLFIGPPKFSQTTHHFLITKKTDVSFTERDQILRESSLSKQLEGKSMSELLSLAPDSNFTVKQGVMLQTLDNSMVSKAKDINPNVQASLVNLEKKSSTETDAMDMDDLRNNHLSGVASSPSKKDVNEGQKSASQDVLASAREEISNRCLGTKLPDAGHKSQAVKDLALSVDKMDTSTSRTQSLDVEHFLSRSGLPTNSRSSIFHEDHLGLEPSSRWVKRLKTSASGSIAYGTKSSKTEEASSHEKVGKFFNSEFQRDKTTSVPLGMSHPKVHEMQVQSEKLLRDVNSSSNGSVREYITLSNAWIRRWCRRSPASQRGKPKALVICEPQRTEIVDNLEKKQFPSIAAMALMGKAMHGFRPCQFKKRGSFVVWNTSDL